MSETLGLTAADGHKLSAYRVDPKGKPRGGIVVAQEIFGVNRHVRGVADGFAADGYAVMRWWRRRCSTAPSAASNSATRTPTSRPGAICE